MTTTFTGTEKVLYRSTYQFAIDVLKLTEAEATEKAMSKILSMRALSKKVKRSEYGH